MELWVDHRPRIDFYVRHGLVKRVPSEAQLRAAARRNAFKAGPFERLNYYFHHPQDLFPTRHKRSLAGMRNDQIFSGGLLATVAAASPAVAGASGERALLGLDRALRAAFLFSPIRFGVQCVHNPWNVVPTTGLNVPAGFVITHLLHMPHPTATWDVQLIQPDPGALEEFERRLDEAERGQGIQARLYRAMAARPGYYDYLRTLISRARAFDYPPTPPGRDPVFDDLVRFLNYAAELSVTSH
jgi:hypothetical protein